MKKSKEVLYSIKPVKTEFLKDADLYTTNIFYKWDKVIPKNYKILVVGSELFKVEKINQTTGEKTTKILPIKFGYNLKSVFDYIRLNNKSIKNDFMNIIHNLNNNDIDALNSTDIRRIYTNNIKSLFNCEI